MEQHKGIFNLERMAKTLKVSRSGYYYYLQTKGDRKADKDIKLVTEIRAIFRASKRTYGSPRIYQELRANGFHINKKRIARLMRINEIRAKVKGRFRSKSKTQLSHIAPNILQQNFICSKPNQKWASDISFIRTTIGWLYLAVIIDLFSRKVVGMAMSTRMSSGLVVKALHEAVGKRSIDLGIIMHSDQGVQYRSEIFQNNLVLYGIIASMSSKGNCYDNSMVESFFGTLKTELEWEGRFNSIEQAKASIFEYVKCWYNNKRRHSALGYLSPNQFEEKYYKNSSYDFVS